MIRRVNKFYLKTLVVIVLVFAAADGRDIVSGPARPEQKRPRTPQPPFPYSQEEIEFDGEGEGVRLSGTLTLPGVEGPLSAVVLVSGAGAQDRDGTIMGHKPFLVIADYLTGRGIAVLRYDDRGTGSSAGRREGATTFDYALDALGAVRALAADERIDTDRIGIVGHSEGGSIAAIAASRCDSVAFVVMLGSPGLPGREYNIQYEESTARAMGQSEEQVRQRLAFQSEVFDIVLGPGGDGEKSGKLGALIMERYPGLTEERVRRALRRFLSPWFVFNLKHDPGETLASLRCPVLALYGSKDVQVPPEGNAGAVREALGLPAPPSDVRVLEGLNHFFQNAPTGSPSEYGTIEETIAPEVLETLAEWIGGLESGGRSRSGAGDTAGYGFADLYSPRNHSYRQTKAILESRR